MLDFLERQVKYKKLKPCGKQQSKTITTQNNISKSKPKIKRPKKAMQFIFSKFLKSYLFLKLIFLIIFISLLSINLAAASSSLSAKQDRSRHTHTRIRKFSPKRYQRLPLVYDPRSKAGRLYRHVGLNSKERVEQENGLLEFWRGSRVNTV